LEEQLTVGQILIVDDNPLLRETLKAVLEVNGFNASACEDGKRALTAIRLTAFDAVIVDIFMPDEDGIGFVLQARAQGFAAPIIAVSGGRCDGSVDFLSIALKLGANAVLPKPFRPQDILQVLRREVDRSAHEQE
jgi:DNA-binding response OmpR family regulator